MSDIKKTKIAVINQPLANRGDEAAHKAFIRILADRFPEKQIDIIFINQNKELIDSFVVNKKNIRYVNIKGAKHHIQFEAISLLLRCPSLALLHPVLRKYKNCLKQYDYIINAPGGICMGGFRNWDHIWQLYISKELNKKIFYWGRSIGPFTDNNYRNKIFKTYSIILLKYFSFLGLRDSKSVEIARSFGINCTEMTDSALMQNIEVSVPDHIQNEIDGKNYFVFVPNQLSWHYKYKTIEQNKIDDYYVSILEIIHKKYADYKIVMLPQTYKSNINDFDYFIKLKKYSKIPKIIIVDENQNSDIQQQIIKNSVFVIGARYHSIIFAINNKKPFIALSYEHKMTGLLENLNLLNRSVNIQDIFYDQEKYDSSLLKIENLLDLVDFRHYDDFSIINRNAFKTLVSKMEH